MVHQDGRVLHIRASVQCYKAGVNCQLGGSLFYWDVLPERRVYSIIRRGMYYQLPSALKDSELRVVFETVQSIEPRNKHMFHFSPHKVYF